MTFKYNILSQSNFFVTEPVSPVEMAVNMCVLFFSHPRSKGWPHHNVLSLFISTILIDSSMVSPVHVLMLSIQAVRVCVVFLWGATTGGVGGGPDPPKFCLDPSNFFHGGSNLGGVRRLREIALRCDA